MDRKTQQLVRTYASYTQAQGAVNDLSGKGFPVQGLSIVGEDLQLVEKVTRRHEYGAAAGQSLLAGALVGALAGYLLDLFGLMEPLASGLALAAAGLLFGALIGMLFGVAEHWITGGRDVSSGTRMQARRYLLVADTEVAEDAVRALDDANLPAAGSRSRASR